MRQAYRFHFRGVIVRRVVGRFHKCRIHLDDILLGVGFLFRSEVVVRSGIGVLKNLHELSATVQTSIGYQARKINLPSFRYQATPSTSER